MCGRYHFSEKTEKDVRRLAGGQPDLPRTGDVRPSENALVLVKGATGSEAPSRAFLAQVMRWGFPSGFSSRLLINARAETALMKPTFAESVQKRRIVIPAAGFYEWDRQKNKVTFFLPEEETIYLAGFYKEIDGECRFIILTTAANASMAPVHDRMPLILPQQDLQDWVFEDGKAAEFLKLPGPALQRRQDYEQMSLF